jgi:aminopeptidase N
MYRNCKTNNQKTFNTHPTLASLLQHNNNFPLELWSIVLTVLLSAIILASCSSQRKNTSPNAISFTADTIEVKAYASQKIYQQTPAKNWILIHTRLDITPRFENRSVKGLARLKLRPGFYATDSLRIDARNFEISRCAALTSNTPLRRWSSDSTSIYVYFSRKLTRTDTLELEIVYTAFPERNLRSGGRAISGAQGFYFINPNGKEPNKPTQIWTQGETDFNANWFPTFDEPNQKTTQEISITLPDSMVSLSNGRFEFSSLNADKTRTDYWAQNKAHSPYLVMVAGGKYHIHKDTWRNIEVNYYVEPEYAADAPFIFGRTPDMLEFYSNLLKTPFPWEKYSQIIVRDYVSGAMENTSATVHGEFVQKRRRELIDEPQEGIIAHELFHQWFGDLVSCENWANLPLNESFATYGEYLWFAHDKGFYVGSANMYHKRRSYFINGPLRPHPLVWHEYTDKLQMFDTHSYPKGAAILHMLRHTLGDEAFFAGLAEYLKRYAHQSAEMHQLRLIFEEITGLDLNPFFNQWVFAQGHPIIQTDTRWDSEKKELKLIFNQKQSLEINPLYNLLFTVGFHLTDTIIYKNVFLNNEREEINVSLPQEPIWVELDTNRHLLAEWKIQQKSTAWSYQLKHARHLEPQMEAWLHLAKDSIIPQYYEAIFEGLKSPYEEIITRSLGSIEAAFKYDAKETERILKTRLTDPRPNVRSAALEAHLRYNLPADKELLLKQALNDSSYRVAGAALRIISNSDSTWALVMAQEFENESNGFVRREVLEIYSLYGGPARFEWFMKQWNNARGHEKAHILRYFGKYLTRQRLIDLHIRGIQLLGPELPKIEPVWLRSAAIDVLIDLENTMTESQKSLRERMEQVPYDSDKRIHLEDLVDRHTAALSALGRYFDAARLVEKNERLRLMLSK